MTFSVTVLGSNSAIPTLTRNPSAHLLNVNERLFLVDCAEGTQLQLRRYRVHFQRIRAIFITHLHGDHFYGLIGLLTSFHLLGRKEEIHLFGPSLLKNIIDLQLDASSTTLIYPLIFHPLEEENGNLIFENENFTVHSFLLQHSIQTWGFLFREKQQPRRIRKEVIGNLNIPAGEFARIKEGKDYTDAGGKVHPNVSLTYDPPAPKSYAYCSDTVYTEKFLPYIKGVDLLYHETTFAQDMVDAAHEKYHSTAMEAATIAKKAGVKRLLIGHFSARYDDPQILLEEARSVFPDTIVAEDGLTINV